MVPNSLTGETAYLFNNQQMQPVRPKTTLAGVSPYKVGRNAQQSLSDMHPEMHARFSLTWNSKKMYIMPRTEGHSPAHTNGAESSGLQGFRTVLAPKRTCQNLRYITEILQKKLRAKTIEQNFDKSNYDLAGQHGKKRGFRGGKVNHQRKFFTSPSKKCNSLQCTLEPVRKQTLNIATTENSQSNTRHFNFDKYENDSRQDTKRETISILPNQQFQTNRPPRVPESSNTRVQTPQYSTNIGLNRKKMKHQRQTNLINRLNREKQDKSRQRPLHSDSAQNCKQMLPMANSLVLQSHMDDYQSNYRFKTGTSKELELNLGMSSAQDRKVIVSYNRPNGLQQKKPIAKHKNYRRRSFMAESNDSN